MRDSFANRHPQATTLFKFYHQFWQNFHYLANSDLSQNNTCRTERGKEVQSIAPQLIAKMESRYDQIIAHGYADTPEPKQKGKQSKRGKCLALLDRLKNYKGSVLPFLHDLRVPFTNNCAEQSIRFEPPPSLTD